MSKKGRLIILSGPSGVGKGTIVKQLLERNPNLRLSVSAATRAPREGEQDGVHYYFISREEFERKITAGELLEYVEYNGNYYGTLREKIEQQMAQGYDVILEIEVEGAARVMEMVPDILSVFILPPSLEALRERLENRHTESPEAVQKRMDRAVYELEQSGKYRYQVVNDQLEDAVQELEALMAYQQAENEESSHVVTTR